MKASDDEVSIGSWRDLEAYGIDALTGEACAYAMRMLCDVTARGKELLESFLGGTVTIRPETNWNGGSKDDPHVGSILLPRGILGELAPFLLLKTTILPVLTTRDGVHRAVTYERAARYATLDTTYITHWWRRASEPATTDRNTHAMSGRTE